MTQQAATHIIATNIDFPGRAVAVPTDWTTHLATLGEAPRDWDEWTAGCTLADELGAVEIHWNEDETFETFEAACRAAGFTNVTRTDYDDEYTATKIA